MLRFGLKGLKKICYIFAALVLACGVYLILNAIAFRTLWHDGDHIIGRIFTISGDVAFFLAIVIICIGIFGILAIHWCKLKCISCFITLLSILLPALIICGFHLYVDSYSDYSANYIRINAFIRGMSPIRLNMIQKTFKCCGIEKYTDYYLMWSLWQINATHVDPKPTGTTAYVEGPYTQRTEKFIYTPMPPGRVGSLKDNRTKISDLDPPTLEELDVILGYFEDPSQKEKYKTEKHARFVSRVDKISSWMNTQLRALREKLKKWVKVDTNYLQQYAPNLMVHAVQNFLKTSYNVYKYYTKPESTPLKWSRTSGWDELSANTVWFFGLPLSCCKNPHSQERCLGRQTDTWREGCRPKLSAYYQRSIYHFAIIILCICPVVFLTLITMYVYKQGLIEHYLF